MLSKSAFPELPSSSSAARVPKAAISGNKSLRNIVGETSVVSAWDVAKGGSNGEESGEAATTNAESSAGTTPETQGGKGKKGKGKQKQTLFTLGVFPT